MYFHAPYLTGLSFFSNEWNYEHMPEFDEELSEDIEEFDALDDVPEANLKVSGITNELDIAVAAWHEDGRWTLGILPDPSDIAQIITSLKSQQTNGGAIALISIDEEFFILIRVLGSHISLFLSDATCALDYPVAEELLEIADIPLPDDDDEEPNPIGHIDILSDLGMNGMELSALCDDAELFPDEQLEAIANRLGFGDQFAELLEL
jgi:putative tRNA adenosine deaminase-associated protein